MAKRNEKGLRQSPFVGLFLPAFLLLLAVVALGISIKVQISLADVTEQLKRQEVDLNQLRSDQKRDEVPTRGGETLQAAEEETDSDELDYFEAPEEEDTWEDEMRTKDAEDKSVSKSKKKHRGVLCGVGSDCKIPRGKRKVTPLGHVVILPDDNNGYHLKEEMLEDGMRLENNALVVSVSGYYFVYSQVQLSDPHAKHATLVNGEPIWGKEAAETSADYHGGVTRLEANARLSVGLPEKLSSNSLKNSFLGAFYVGNDKKQKKRSDFFFGHV